jgi:hypothetical protein
MLTIGNRTGEAQDLLTAIQAEYVNAFSPQHYVLDLLHKITFLLDEKRNPPRT